MVGAAIWTIVCCICAGFIMDASFIESFTIPSSTHTPLRHSRLYSHLKNDLLIRAARGERVEKTPVSIADSLAFIFVRVF